MCFDSMLLPSEGWKRYEAIYHIGRISEDDRYVLHLLDTFPPSIMSISGISQHKANGNYPTQINEYVEAKRERPRQNYRSALHYVQANSVPFRKPNSTVS